MSRKTDVIVADALEKSKVLTETIPQGRGVHRINAERIVAVCKDLPPIARAAIGGWLAEMETGIGGLEIDDLGIRISRRARPNQVIVSAEVLEALRAIYTKSKQSAIPSPAASS